MTTLKDRLTEAMGETVTRAELATKCKVSRAAVSKWFSQDSKSLKAEHVFLIARLCQVDAEWLATGEGRPKRKAAAIAEDVAKYGDIPQRRIDLIKAYGRLPKDVRAPIRTLIETLAIVHSERYATYSRSLQAMAEERDSKPKKESARER